jgi:predicted phage terminase large subunit-like protein
MINDFPYTIIEPSLPLIWAVAVDFALTEKQENDATAVQPFAMDHLGNCYLDEPFHFRLTPHEAIEKVLDLCDACRVKNNGGVMLAQERGVIDRAIKPQLELRILERDLPVTVLRLSVPGDKKAKARVLQARMQQGRVFFKKCRFFDEVWLPEFLGFGGGMKHDDLVDAAALAAYMIDQGIMAAPPAEAPPEDEPDDDFEAMMKRVKTNPSNGRQHVPTTLTGEVRAKNPRIFR